MAHYARVYDSVVMEVRRMEEEYYENDFIANVPGDWFQTSYNTRQGIHWNQEEDGTLTQSEDQTKALRGNFASAGMLYSWDNDYFYDPSPYPSWTYDDTVGVHRWIAPIAMPDDGNEYVWDEDAYQADNTAGWVQITESGNTGIE